MKDLNVLKINEINNPRTLDFIFFPWRERRCGLPKNDWELLERISFELFLLDGGQCFFDQGYKQVLEQMLQENKQLYKRLSLDPFRMLGLKLNLKYYNRFFFNSSVIALLENNDFIKRQPPEADRAWRSFLEPREAEISLGSNFVRFAWSRYHTFIKKYVFSKFFLILFTLPYKESLKLPQQDIKRWVEYLEDLSGLLKDLQSLLKPKYVSLLLNFWLYRTHEANLWPGLNRNGLLKALKTICEGCFMNDDPESNRVLTYAEYSNSFLAAQLIRDSGGDLYFPIDGYGRNSGKSDIRGFQDWVDRDIYNRMASCTLNAMDHATAKQIIKACENSGSISDSEVLKTIGYLKWFSSTHFMGNWGELVGLPLVLRWYDKPSEALTCIPGSAIRLKGKYGLKQGPDGLLAKVYQGVKGIHLVIHGIIEIKSYNPGWKRINIQLKRHLTRLKHGEIQIMVSGEKRNNYWTSWDTIFDEKERRIMKVSSVEFLEPVDNIIVQPFQLFRRCVTGQPENMFVLEFPWKREGFRGMGVGFCGWLIQNLARTIAPDDYELGWETWRLILERLMHKKTLTRRNRLMVEQLYGFLTGAAPTPDIYWL